LFWTGSSAPSLENTPALVDIVTVEINARF
jgi:hypothetical protein